jgi:Ca-activated chloride channel family protein
MKTLRSLLALAVLLSVAACDSFSNQITLTVTANTSLTAWLMAEAGAFNAAGTKTTDGKAIRVEVQGADSGQAITNMLEAGTLPAVWLPDDAVWAEVLADKGQPAFQGNCVSVAKSPLVIAVWRPLAESLGWPGRTLGWLDIGSLAADQSAWAYYSGGQYGEALRLGHTHPGLSATGASTLLAVVQAAQSKSTEAVTEADIAEPIVRASVGAFEGAVSWFSKSTTALGDAMQERGSNFLGAAVMYESDVIQHGQAAPGLVPLYPFEGTFVATHPACLNTTLEAPLGEAAGLFRDYLLRQAAQQHALASGLRPVNAVPLGFPLDASNGVDVTQPAIVFPSPSVATLYAAQSLWQSERKPVNLVMLLDVSGSMQGEKIANLRQAAVQFVNQMGNDDYLTLITFSDQPALLLNHEKVSEARAQATRTIESLLANGGTALFDAIAEGAQAIDRHTSSNVSNVMVVLTDGQDTASLRFDFDSNLVTAATANATTMFTIAYGGDADENILSDLARRANGNFYRGTEANITQIYDEMSAAFGGNAGIGR